MIDNGIFSRDASTISKKITRLEKAWRNANDIRNRTGEGSLTTAHERKVIEGWADDNPKWLSLEKSALAPILKKCKYYFELEPFFEIRHGNTRLAPGRSLDDDDTNNVEIVSHSHRVAREHSVHSNLAYENDENKIETMHRDRIDHSLNSNLAHNDHIGGSDETMEEIHRMLENEDDDRDLTESNPITPSRPSQTQHQAQKSNVNMRRTTSKSSLVSSSLGSSRKRASSRKSGSEASIQDLLKNNPLDHEIDFSNGPVSQLHSQKLDRLSQLADNVASNMFPPPQKSFLTEDDSKKKAKIELDMASVQLKGEKKKLEQHSFDLLSRREKHNLEMQKFRAEIEHEQITRNAQLISMLMKDNNLSLQDAMMAAQTAQAMSQSSSTLNSSLTLQSSSTKQLSSNEQSDEQSSSDE